MMNALFKKPVGLVIDRMAGKKKYQFFFIWLYNIAIKGFNLRNFHIKENGERA